MRILKAESQRVKHLVLDAVQGVHGTPYTLWHTEGYAVRRLYAQKADRGRVQAGEAMPSSHVPQGAERGEKMALCPWAMGYDRGIPIGRPSVWGRTVFWQGQRLP